MKCPASTYVDNHPSSWETNRWDKWPEGIGDRPRTCSYCDELKRGTPK